LVSGVEELGGMALKLAVQGIRGFPDRTVVLPVGRVNFVEVKRPKGGRLSRHQQDWISTLRGMGFYSTCVWSADTVDRFVKRCGDQIVAVRMKGGGATIDDIARELRRGRTYVKQLLHHKEPNDQRAYLREYHRSVRDSVESWIKGAYHRARRRCHKSGRAFDITADDIREVYPSDDRCPVFGVPFVRGEHSPRNASLDCIDPKMGYVVGNIAVISRLANAMKQDASLADVEALAAWLRRVL